MDRLLLRQTHLDDSESPALLLAQPADYDEAMSDYSSSAESLRKPLQPFDTPLEDALPMRPARRSWWALMTVRARRKRGADESKEGADEGLLADIYTRRRISRRTRTWYNYCLFGGISGLTIM
jgi:hypothetical protein